MNAPALAYYIRRCGVFICKLAKPFTPETESQKQVRNLMSFVRWQDQLEDRTDREIGMLAARIFGEFEIGTEKDALMGEIVDRLTRSPLGANCLDGQGNRVFGIPLIIRLIPNTACDGCHNIGYVCDKSRLCPYCIGLKVSVETRRQKLTGTLRSRFAAIGAEVKEKLRKFNGQV